MLRLPHKHPTKRHPIRFFSTSALTVSACSAAPFIRPPTGSTPRRALHRQLFSSCSSCFLDRQYLLPTIIRFLSTLVRPTCPDLRHLRQRFAALTGAPVAVSGGGATSYGGSFSSSYSTQLGGPSALLNTLYSSGYNSASAPIQQSNSGGNFYSSSSQSGNLQSVSSSYGSPSAPLVAAPSYGNTDSTLGSKHPPTAHHLPRSFRHLCLMVSVGSTRSSRTQLWLSIRTARLRSLIWFAFLRHCASSHLRNSIGAFSASTVLLRYAVCSTDSIAVFLQFRTSYGSPSAPLVQAPAPAPICAKGQYTVDVPDNIRQESLFCAWWRLIRKIHPCDMRSSTGQVVPATVDRLPHRSSSTIFIRHTISSFSSSPVFIWNAIGSFNPVTTSYAPPSAPLIQSPSYGSPPAAPLIQSPSSYGSPSSPLVQAPSSYPTPSAPLIQAPSYGAPLRPSISYGTPSAPLVQAPTPSYGTPSAPLIQSPSLRLTFRFPHLVLLLLQPRLQFPCFASSGSTYGGGGGNSNLVATPAPSTTYSYASPSYGEPHRDSRPAVNYAVSYGNANQNLIATPAPVPNYGGNQNLIATSAPSSYSAGSPAAPLTATNAPFVAIQNQLQAGTYGGVGSGNIQTGGGGYGIGGTSFNKSRKLRSTLRPTPATVPQLSPSGVISGGAGVNFNPFGSGSTANNNVNFVDLFNPVVTSQQLIATPQPFNPVVSAQNLLPTTASGQAIIRTPTSGSTGSDSVPPTAATMNWSFFVPQFNGMTTVIGTLNGPSSNTSSPSPEILSSLWTRQEVSL
ncbi:hypothetical protein BV898_01595 [Hypsibius exemplaris]|uniref:Uncharacterized protein n=1 Tax=Hypsibius exemplaris TaxID=2072580 RepID=A0A1W0XAH8_HYPEX|nr:hypothetical protein BV898_01595 [Hypsibius exemplaris]